jgi:DNA-binding NtrC family response regulator
MNGKILLVDDEEDFTAALSQRMEARGFKVDVASNGYEALEKVNSRSYDAIILDLLMPGIDGLETLQCLRAKNEDLQVILLTGHATLDKGIKAIRLGALEILEKPADMQKLLTKIEEAKSNRLLLVEKRAEEIVKTILKKKGW